MAMLPGLLNAGENALRKTGTSALANLIGNEVVGATGKALAASTAKNLGTQIAVNAINKASAPIAVNTLGKATQYRGVSANSMQDLLNIVESSKNSAPATYTGGQTYGNGAYFFNNPEDAKNWAVAHQPGEYKAVLSIDRPLGSYLDYGTYRKNRSDFISRLDAPGSQINQIADAAFNKYMDKNGVTGYVGNNYEGRNPVYVVKNPEAMKNLRVSSVYTPDTKDWAVVEGDLQNFVKQNNLETYLGSPENQSNGDMMTLYRGLSQKYDPNYPVARLDTSGYESWTDNPELAKQYGDYVYSIDVPRADIKSSYLDENPNSPTYGDRNPIYSIDKKAGLNGVSGNEYLLEAGSDYQKGLKYNEYQSPKIQYSKVDNLNPTGNPDIRYAKGGKTLTEMANDIKAERAAKELSPDVRRIGSTEVMDIDANTLPAGYEKLTKYLEADPNAIIEQYIGGKPEDVDFTDKLAKFIEQEGYETKPNVVDNLRIARQIINDKVAEDLDADGATKYGQFLRTRGALQKDNPNRGVGPRTFTISANKNQIYQTDAAKLDKEYSDRLGIGRSHTPMNDKALSTDAKGYYMGGGIGINPTEAIGESGVSTIAHERMHSWQDIKPGEWDSRVVDAVQELRDELKEFYHTKAEIKAYRRSGSDLDYYADPNEQEARMLQSYLDNENFTDSANRHKTSGVEWGEEIKPAFDKFYKKLRELSKLGVALPAVAALFGLSLNGGEDVDNIE